ncbi:MAG: crossover junction endodeoxyribonuclease RuvC [Candidatus Omnitrophica bacterium]|nr:crossover junction endodeoxyribonuclease RuvC [Candidatus Omnitrophota bacterium]
MRILGIDPGLYITGYGLIDCNKSRCSLIEAGIIKTGQKEALPERLGRIFRGLCGLIEETRPDAMVLEKLYAHYKHPLTSCLLGHARGAACLAAANSKIAFVEYPSTRIKKAIVGRGSASKGQVKRMVESILGAGTLDGPYDATDALAAAMTHFHVIRSKV